MRNLLALVGLLVVGGAGLGWYLGWYKVGVHGGTDGQQRITIDVDTKKASGDTRRFGESVAEFIDEKAKRGEAAADEVKANAVKLATPPTGGVTIQVPPIRIGGSDRP
jgi:hypothetical protein